MYDAAGSQIRASQIGWTSEQAASDDGRDVGAAFAADGLASDNIVEESEEVMVHTEGYTMMECTANAPNRRHPEKH